MNEVFPNCLKKCHRYNKYGILVCMFCEKPKEYINEKDKTNNN